MRYTDVTIVKCNLNTGKERNLEVRQSYEAPNDTTSTEQSECYNTVNEKIIHSSGFSYDSFPGPSWSPQSQRSPQATG